MTGGGEIESVLDAAQDGWALASAVRDGTGRIVDFRLTYVNEPGARILGHPPAELIGKLYSGLWPDLSSAGLIDAYAAAVDTREPFTRSFYYDDGVLSGYFEVRIRPYGDGFAVGFANVADGPLSGRPRSSTEIQLRSALDVAFDGFVLISPVVGRGGEITDFVLDYVNETSAKLSGVEVRDLVGHRLGAIRPAAVGLGLLDGYVQTAYTGEPHEEQVTDPLDGTVWEVRASRVDEHVLAVSYRDITTRVRHEERAVASEAEIRLSSRRIAALQSVTAALARARTLSEVFQIVTGQAQPLASWHSVVIMLREEDRLVVAHTAGLTESAQRGLEDTDPNDAYPMYRVVRNRVPLFYGNHADYLADYPDRAQQHVAAGRGAWAFVPLLAAGRAIGALALGYQEEREFSAREREALVTLGELYAQAIERARLYEAQRSIAADLQRALLPADLPTVTGARHAARYLPWTEGADVGGDWYDLIPLDGGALGVVIGDVAGHSTSAAATMGQIRNALRAYAIDGHSPTSVMERVNRLLLTLDPGALATCCYLEMHLDEGTATAVLAGHLPPILCDGGKGGQLDLRLSPPLGVTPDARYVDTTVLLPPGSALLLYTDGLVEDRRFPIDRGLAELTEALCGDVPDDPELLVERVLAAGIGPNPRSDDVALLALTIEGGTGTDREPTASRQFRGDASNAASARRFAADVLVAWGLADLVDTTRLLLGEVITNAVQHTVGDVGVRLSLNAHRLRVEVRDTSDRTPDMRVPGPDSESGRGLQIVATLASAWGHDAAGVVGKVVWFELARR